MIRSNDLNDRGEELIAKFPTRFFLTANEAMARSSIEISGSSRVFVLPCGVFTWTDGDGYWIHPEYGNRHQLHEFDDDFEADDDAPGPTEVAERVTYDDPFSDDNFGPWELLDGDVVETTIVSAEAPRSWI